MKWPRHTHTYRVRTFQVVTNQTLSVIHMRVPEPQFSIRVVGTHTSPQHSHATKRGTQDCMVHHRRASCFPSFFPLASPPRPSLSFHSSYRCLVRCFLPSHLRRERLALSTPSSTTAAGKLSTVRRRRYLALAVVRTPSARSWRVYPALRRMTSLSQR